MERTRDVIVIGAGQAGLATGYWLSRAGLDFMILDRGDRVGDAWRRHWDSLRLFSPTRSNHLPGMQLPGEPWAFPTKDEVADYLEAYAARFDLPVLAGARVRRMRRVDDQFELETDDHCFAAKRVVVATGSHAAAVVPEWASRLDPSILQLTAKRYRNAREIPLGDVLVVGAGNSGVQIAMEIAATRTTWLAGRDTGCLPRRILHHDVSFWMDLLGVMRIDVESALGRSIVARIGHKGFPVVGISRAEIAARGVRRVPCADGVEHGKPRLSDGRILDVRSVVWCCGLSPDLSFIEGLSTDEHDSPRHARGCSEEIDGLYFMGLRFQSRLGSDLLGGVGRDAEEITGAILTSLGAGGSRRAA